jgi:hypothetical protein
MIENNTKKRKRLNQQKRSPSKSKKKFQMGHTGKLILDYFKVVSRSSTNNHIRYSPDVKQSPFTTKTRPQNYFDDCIVIDSDDDDKTKNNDGEENQVIENDSGDYDIKEIERHG